MLRKPDDPEDDQTAAPVRSLDLGINLSCLLEVVPKGVTYTSTTSPENANEHGFVGVSGLRGMNAGEERHLPGDNERSSSRFLRAGITVRLEGVYGEHSEGATVFHTIFSVVRDHTNRTLYFRGVHNASLRKIDFSAGGSWPWIYFDPDPTSPGHPLDFAQDVTGMLRGAESTVTGQILEPRKLTLR